MALSIVAINSRDELENGTTFTMSHSCSGSNRLLVVCIPGCTTTRNFTCTSVKYNGIPLSLAVKREKTTSYYLKSYIYYLVNPPAGTYDVEVNFDIDPGECASMVAVSFSGADQTDPIGATGSNLVKDEYISVTVSTERSNSYLIDAEGCATVNNHEDPSQTRIFTGMNGRTGVSYKVTGASGNYTMLWTGTDYYRVLCVAEIKEWVPIPRSHGYIFG